MGETIKPTREEIKAAVDETAMQCLKLIDAAVERFDMGDKDKLAMALRIANVVWLRWYSPVFRTAAANVSEDL